MNSLAKYWQVRFGETKHEPFAVEFSTKLEEEFKIVNDKIASEFFPSNGFKKLFNTLSNAFYDLGYLDKMRKKGNCSWLNHHEKLTQIHVFGEAVYIGNGLTEAPYIGLIATAKNYEVVIAKQAINENKGVRLPYSYSSSATYPTKLHDASLLWEEGCHYGYANKHQGVKKFSYSQFEEVLNEIENWTSDPIDAVNQNKKPEYNF